MAENEKVKEPEHVSSPEQLDQTITVINHHGWVSLVALGVLLVAAIIWGIFGRIPEKVNGAGLLINSSDLMSVTYSYGGTIKNVFLESGMEVQKGQIIARIEREDLLESIQVANLKLEILQQTYDTSTPLITRQADMTDEMLAKSEKDFQTQIVNVSNQLDTAKRKEKTMKELFDDGLITEMEYLETRKEVLSMEMQKQSAEQQLLNAGVNRVKTSSDLKQEKMNLQHQIDEAKKQLEIAQRNYQIATKIISPVAGKIYEVSVARGSYVAPGSTVAIVEPYLTDGETLRAVMYFPVKDGKRVKRGMNIAVIPTTTKQEEYGFIQGIVTSVSDFPVSPQYLQTVMQNPVLAQSFTAESSPIEVRISMVPDPTTETGFKWSSSRGPNDTLTPGISTTGFVIVRSQRPIEMIVPLIKKKVLGIGE
ncbi:MAG: NHLP bacteriocin system secretion protein [Spirochaetia bacterium]|nr:NHLP bacteriocin system secretion protein [Spirochaetia bacterium]